MSKGRERLAKVTGCSSSAEDRALTRDQRCPTFQAAEGSAEVLRGQRWHQMGALEEGALIHPQPNISRVQKSKNIPVV